MCLIKKTIGFFTLWLICVSANAALVFSGPAQDADGNYTLSWTGRGAYALLNEKINGSWQTIAGGQIDSFNVTGKAAGTYEYKLDNYCQVGPASPYHCESVTKTVTVGPTAPIISGLLNVTFNEDTANVVSFTISDEDTSSSLLTVSASSSNTTVVPASGLAFGGSGSSRTLTITPAENQNGSVSITVSVSDGVRVTSRSFTAYITAINDSPTISTISAKTINEDSSTGAISFNVNDIEIGGGVTVSASSSNTTLVSVSSIVLGGSGTNRTVTVTPASNLSGSATITLTVSDGALSSSTSFVVTVNAVNDTPFISDITNRTINEDGGTGAIGFSISDLETASASLSVSATSSNTSLIPNGNIVLGGSGSSRTISVSPLANANGSSTITVTVSDGQAAASDTFVVTVNSINDAPSINPIANVSINEGVANSGGG